MSAQVSASPILRAFRLLVAAGLGWTVLAGLAAGDGAARHTATRADDSWIVIASNRDGVNRAYSIRPDGLRLTPLLAGRRLTPFAVSRNGETVAYTTYWYGDGPIYLSRANGTGLHRVAKDNVGGPTLSHDGRWIAYSPSDVAVVWIVRSDGRGRRRVLRCSCGVFDWSPNRKSFLLEAFKETAGGFRGSVVVQPLHGKRRVIARYGEDSGYHGDAEGASWSPDGRWIAYLDTEDNDRKIGLHVVRPNSKGLRRIVRGAVLTLAWSPNGKKLAFTRENGQLGVVGVEGRGLRRVPFPARAHNVEWSPDGRQLAVEASSGDDPPQIFVLGEDGRDARRVTAEGENGLVGWTKRAPALPPAAPIPPSERVVDPRSVATVTPVTALSADGTRVAFVAKARPSDCEHAAVWAAGEPSIARFDLPAPCPPEARRAREVTLAGSRVAWTLRGSEGEGECSVGLVTTTLANPQPMGIHRAGPNQASCAPDYYHVRGDGELLVFNDESRLKRIGPGRVTCNGDRDSGAKICATLRRNLTGSVDSVSGTSIAVRRPGAVTVYDERGQLVRQFPFAPADVRAARLDGSRLVVWRFGVLEVYDLATGTRVGSHTLPVGFRLVDVDGGVAVLLGGATIALLRLDDGASRTISPGGAPVLADLEPAGLYYSYATGGGGQITLLPRNEAEPARRAG
jgi:Tol biopolymer transport system component